MKVAVDPTSGIRNFFEDNGYYLARGVYGEESLQLMQRDFDRIVAQLEESGERINARWSSDSTDQLDGGASVVIHTHNVQRYSARWLEAFQDRQFLDTAEQILGPDIVLHHTKLFLKPPREGAPFPMHQDWSYFPTRYDSMVAGIIFLSDADSESGGVCVYPGSHKFGRLQGSAGRELAGREDSSDSGNSDFSGRYPLEKSQPIDAKRGDVLFFSCLTLHGSTPNRSDRHRKTVLVQLHSGSDYVLDREGGHEHVNERLTLRGWNHHMSRDRAEA